MMTTLLISATIFAPQGELDQPIAPGTLIEFKAESLDGKQVGSASIVGKTTLIALWGTWSAPSSRALEIAQAMHDEFGPKGLRVISLACWDTKENVLGFRRANPQLGFDFWFDPRGGDTDSSLAVKVFKTRRFPTFYVLDKQQKVVQGFIGARAVNKADVSVAVKKSL